MRRRRGLLGRFSNGWMLDTWAAWRSNISIYIEVTYQELSAGFWPGSKPSTCSLYWREEMEAQVLTRTGLGMARPRPLGQARHPDRRRLVGFQVGLEV